MKRLNIYVAAGVVLVLFICVIYSLQSKINNLQSKIDSQKNISAIEISNNQETVGASSLENPIEADLYRFLEGQQDPTDYEITYQGIMWSSLFSQDLGYFLPLLDRILLSKDYVWMGKRDCTPFIDMMNSLESIRAEGKNVEGIVIGFNFDRPITSMITELPSDIDELWFELNDDKCLLHSKNKNGEWSSYEIMGDEFFLERKLMKQLIISIKEKEALETP